MRNRWFHPPTLHMPRHEFEKKPGWLELFYDLVFVAAFIQLGNGLSNNVSVFSMLAFAGIFAPLWMAWVGFTYYANRFNVDDILHRVLVIVQMFAVGAMGVTAAGVLKGDHVPFAVSYTFAQFLISALYYRSYLQEKLAQDYSKYWGNVFALGGALWLISCFVPSPWCYLFWAAGLLCILGSPLHKQSRKLIERFPIDLEYLSERFGLLTIIVLGESFVKVILSLSGEAANFVLLGQASFTLLITVCIWWIYFDDIAGSKIREGKLNPIFWLYGHLPLQIGITATGVAIKKAIFFDLSVPAPEKYRWFLSGTLAIVLISTSFIDAVTERRQAELSDKTRVNVRAFSALFILLLAPAGGGMTALWYLVLITLICVGQVIFDMMTAPMEDEKGSSPEETISDIYKKQQLAADKSTAAPRRTVDEAIRKGTPSALRHDLYFYFMEGSWARFIGALAFLYLIVNIFFASLYMLSPGSIADAASKSFSDAFFFSVQTMSTIGYGALSPGTLYGDIIVTIEAAFGLFGVAVVTGLVFAKVSRPRSSVLFSKSAVVNQRYGKKFLQLRVGNARGNDVVDASLSLSALVDEISPEGEHMRRVIDLKLVRERQPFFKLTWSVFHEINESSPLFNMNLSGENAELLNLLVTLTGHDGTYGQTIYARHAYYPEDIRENHRYVDVIHQLEDGRMMVDYSKFHDTQQNI